MSPDPSFRAAPPLAKRLNRNALTVAAVIMGMTVLTAVVVLSPGRGGQSGARNGEATGAPSVQSRPTFLDSPVPGGAANPESTAVEQRSLSPFQGTREHSDSPAPRYRYVARVNGRELVSAARQRAFQAALRSQVVAGGLGQSIRDQQPARESDAFGPETASAELRLLNLGDSLTRASFHPSVGERTTSERQRHFLVRAGNTGDASIIGGLEPTSSRFTLVAGTVVPGVLVTGINSELPGDIVGQVSRDVYDSRTERILLVPKGSKLIGTYDNQVVAGQGRLLVAWTRLILPDGRSMKLPGLALKDPAGQTGASDRVDHHFSRVFSHALLLSAISAGAQLSQPRQGNVLSTPSAGQVAAGALGQELSNVALEILRRGMDVPPTITIRQGQPFLVFLNGDLVFDGPYQPSP